MTFFSRIIFASYTILFGKVIVDAKYIDRAKRMFRSALIEQEQEFIDAIEGTASALGKKSSSWMERIDDHVCEVLVQEACERATSLSHDGKVRWREFLISLLSVAEITGKALSGDEISDTRVKRVLEINGII
jgi:hypothetical protein